MRPRYIETRELNRSHLLIEMCWIAENIESIYSIGSALTNTRFVSDGNKYWYYRPREFKPGVADRFIFNKILDNVWEVLERDFPTRWGNNYICAMNIMAQWYYPKYGEWVQDKKVVHKRETNGTISIL